MELSPSLFFSFPESPQVALFTFLRQLIRDGILREHARGRNLADCGRICGSLHKSFGSIVEINSDSSSKLTEIHIVNHLEHFFHISSIEPTDLRELPQILPQSAKFLPRAGSRRSHNIPSLLVTFG